MIADTLRANGANGGRIDKHPMVVADSLRSHPRPGSNSSGALVASPLEASDGHHGYSSPRGDGADNLIVAAPLTAGGHPNSNMPGRRKEDDENLVATSITLASDPISARELAQPSTKRNGDPGVVQYGASVRRLTPTECERLQALPDGWTDLGATPDSRRYAALGDAVTSSVAYWIASRIKDQLQAEPKLEAMPPHKETR